jgi:hypothetical protein
MRPLQYCVLLLLIVVAVLGLRHINAGSQAFTGCLNAKGSLSRVAIGAEPTKPCEVGQTEVTWGSDPPPGADGTLGLEGQSCPDGEVLAGFDGSGGLICETP